MRYISQMLIADPSTQVQVVIQVYKLVPKMVHVMWDLHEKIHLTKGFAELQNDLPRFFSLKTPASLSPPD